MAWQKNFAGKVSWRKSHQKKHSFIAFQARLTVNEYVASGGADAARVLDIIEDPKSIDFDALPDKCFIKACYGWGWIFSASSPGCTDS